MPARGNGFPAAQLRRRRFANLAGEPLTHDAMEATESHDDWRIRG
jgi:hypothetical protein